MDDPMMSQHQHNNANDQVRVMALPPGLKFRPTDEELILDYLMNKVNDFPLPVGSDNFIPVVNFYRHNPQELIGSTMQKIVESEEWHFFTLMEGNGVRPSRLAKGGFWKTTGKDKPVYHMGLLIGHKRVLDFYEDGKRTQYKMHEYTTTARSSMTMKYWVVNKIYKNKQGMKRIEDEGEEKEVNPNGNLPNFHLDINPDFNIDQDWFAGLPEMTSNHIFTTPLDWQVDPFDQNIVNWSL